MELQKRLEGIFETQTELNDILKKITKLLHDEIPYYNWVGFYFNNGDKAELKLSEYTGAETEHTIIPFGKGICGQVALSNENFVVPNVAEQDNYLSCSIDTKAEIVVPIFKNGKNVGQIDIDSHTINPFTDKDVELLEWIANKVSTLL